MTSVKAPFYPLRATSFSPKGELFFVNIKEPVLKMDEEDSKENYEYRLVLRLEEKAAEAFLNKLNATVAEAGFDMKSPKTHKFSLKHATERVPDPKDPEKYLKDADGSFQKQVIDGKYDFSFQNFAYRKMKDGTFEQREIPVYDSHSERVDPDAVPEIGNGTIGRVAFYAGAYDSPKKRGVKPYLQGVQIIELVERTGSSGVEIKFPEEEDGFTVPAVATAKDSVGAGFKAAAAELDDEIPF